MFRFENYGKGVYNEKFSYKGRRKYRTSAFAFECSRSYREEIKKPYIGIVSSKNDIVPGHMNIDKIVDAVKQGVALAGGVTIVFPAIAV